MFCLDIHNLVSQGAAVPIFLNDGAGGLHFAQSAILASAGLV
jgi:hypothetical protein